MMIYLFFNNREDFIYCHWSSESLNSKAKVYKLTFFYRGSSKMCGDYQIHWWSCCGIQKNNFNIVAYFFENTAVSNFSNVACIKWSYCIALCSPGLILAVFPIISLLKDNRKMNPYPLFTLRFHSTKKLPGNQS